MAAPTIKDIVSTLTIAASDMGRGKKVAFAARPGVVMAVANALLKSNYHKQEDILLFKCGEALAGWRPSRIFTYIPDPAPDESRWLSEDLSLKLPRDGKLEEIEKAEDCAACGFKTEELKLYPSRRIGQARRKPKYMCSLCASTMAGNAYDFPEFYPDTKDVLTTICYIGNVILEQIKERSHK